MPDQIQSFLDGLGRGSAKAPPPPDAFLMAVGRRRRQRRLAQVATIVASLVVVVGAGLITRQALQRPGGPDRDLVLAVAVPAPASHRGLIRMNPEATAEALRLPPDALIGTDQPIQVGMRWEPAQIEQWVSR